MLTIHEAAAAMRRGDLTPVELLDQCLARIDVYEPAVRAWVVIDRDGAREQAERLTAELTRGEDRGPLHGIPVGVKDIIDVFDLPTGCGSMLWANSVARQDATCVKRLRQAGAVILGKTVTTAYAYLDPPVTRNPWNLDRTPGGSSSGSAAAVACGMCLAALGTQTVGSLTRPASYCGVCAYKPARAVTDLDGALPLAPTFDHIGVVARCVRDVAILADCIDGENLDSRSEAVWDIDTSPIRPPLVVGGFFAERSEPSVWERVATACGPASGRGALPWMSDELLRHLRAILATEATQFHCDRFRQRPDDYPPRIAELIEAGFGVSANDYLDAELHRAACRRQLREAWPERDAILATPAAPGVAPARATTGDGTFNAPWSYVGRPTISVPIDRLNELPVAAQLASSDDGTTHLFRAAAWLEREARYAMRLPPIPK